MDGWTNQTLPWWCRSGAEGRSPGGSRSAASGSCGCGRCGRWTRVRSGSDVPSRTGTWKSQADGSSSDRLTNVDVDGPTCPSRSCTGPSSGRALGPCGPPALRRPRSLPSGTWTRRAVKNWSGIRSAQPGRLTSSAAGWRTRRPRRPRTDTPPPGRRGQGRWACTPAQVGSGGTQGQQTGAIAAANQRGGTGSTCRPS